MALPCVLVLGGLGMIGRNFVKYLVEAGGDSLVSHIRVVDKTIVSMAHLTDDYQKIFSHPLVQLIQGDVNSDAVLDKVFVPPAEVGGTYTLVVNLAAPSNYNLPEAMYPLVITNLRLKCATKARAMACDKYVEVSTAHVYKTGSKAAKESDLSVLKPWTVLARHHLAAEEAIAQLPGLNWVVLRLPNVYGPGDLTGLMPRIACAAAYEYAENKMQLLWGDDLRMHTIHVQDAAAALWFLFCAGEVGQVYNLADDNDTTQGKFNKVLEECFKPGLKTSCAGTVLNTLAQVKGLDAVSQEANQEHLETWLEMCSQTGTAYTPVTTEVHRELLGDHSVNIDSSKIKALGFQCSCPAPNVDLVRDSIDYWVSQKKFPVAK